jgi:hypothetical protein
MRVFMKGKLKWVTAIGWYLAIIPFYAGMLLVYPFTFNFELEINYHYGFITYAVFVPLLFTGYSIIRGRSLPVAQQLFHTVLLSVMVILLICYRHFIGNEHLCMVISVLLIGTMIAGDDGRHIELMWAGLLLFYMAELAAGIFQLTGQLGNAAISVAGTLQNSGIYSLYIIIHIPLCRFFCRRYLPHSKWYSTGIIVFILIISITLLIIWVNQSRTAFVSLFVICFLMVADSIKKPVFTWKGPRTAFLIGGVLACMISVVLLVKHFATVKQGSAQGRLLMLAITKKHLTEDVWPGVGIGRFSWYYPQWQADYFNHIDPSSTLQWLHAGETYIIFNEYLLFYKETGLIGLLLAVTVLIYFFTRTSPQEAYFVKNLKLMVAGILASGLTSYPFHTGPVLLLTILCLFSVFVLCNKQLVTGKIGLKLINLLVALPVCLILFYITGKVVQWQQNRDMALSSEKRIKRCRALLPALTADGKFLAEYGEALLYNQSHAREAVEVLEKGRENFLSYRSMEATARAWHNLGQYDSSLKRYHFLSNYIPSKFLPRLEIAQLYLTVRDTANAQKTAQDILTMPVKIPSMEVKEIQREAGRIIQLKN